MPAEPKGAVARRQPAGADRPSPTAAVELARFCIGSDATVRAAIARIDGNHEGIVLVTDAAGCLVGTLTDGDIRRAVLADVDMDGPLMALLEGKRGPVSAPAGTSREAVLAAMRHHDVRQIPLVDEAGRVVDLLIERVLLRDLTLPMQAVVMAGGFGTRLAPLTDTVPKPMLPLGGKPLLEHTVTRLRGAGIQRVSITTHYRAEQISDHFGDGRSFDVDLRYIEEKTPLGTAGALRLLGRQDQPLLVMNGDVLTDVDFASMYAFHREHGADLTLAVTRYEHRVPYGVAQCEGPFLTGLVEKPRHRFFVNAGIYIVEPRALRHLPPEGRFDMTDLVDALLGEGDVVVTFPVREYWLDIGQHADYAQAQDDVAEGRLRPPSSRPPTLVPRPPLAEVV